MPHPELKWIQLSFETLIDPFFYQMASVEVVIMASEATYHVAFTLDEQNVETMTNKLQGEIAVQAAIIEIIITIWFKTTTITTVIIDQGIYKTPLHQYEEVVKELQPRPHFRGRQV